MINFIIEYTKNTKIKAKKYYYKNKAKKQMKEINLKYNI